MNEAETERITASRMEHKNETAIANIRYIINKVTEQKYKSFSFWDNYSENGFIIRASFARSEKVR